MSGTTLNPKLRISRGVNPRRNLPNAVSRKRGESNFLRAFERSYLEDCKKYKFARSEFDLHGYGIADLVLMSSVSLDCEEEGMSVGFLPKQVHLMAFELKLKDWRKALKQAFRYSYFADETAVVLPPETAEVALRSKEAFQHSNIALWSFDKKTGEISHLIHQTKKRARNEEIKARAIAALLELTQFSKTLKAAKPA